MTSRRPRVGEYCQLAPYRPFLLAGADARNGRKYESDDEKKNNTILYIIINSRMKNSCFRGVERLTSPMHHNSVMITILFAGGVTHRTTVRRQRQFLANGYDREAATST